SQGESSHVRRPNRGDTSEISSIKGFPTKSRGSTDSSKVSAEVTPCTRQGKEYAYVETARGRKEVAPRGSCPTGQEVKLSGARSRNTQEWFAGPTARAGRRRQAGYDRARSSPQGLFSKFGKKCEGRHRQA